ncbi:MAG TPA: cupin domain-containing protein [Polyangiaceae bacterium]|nr:cupin domain-containing protein [Polyangiaceae bacterium]
MTDEELFLALADAAEPLPVGDAAKLRLRAALDADPYLPFSSELARHFDLPAEDVRALLRKIDDPEFWIRDVSPMHGHLDFTPGPSLRPLHGGFARMLSGMRIQKHRHVHRELTYVLSGTLSDGEREYGPGEFIDMPEGSVHEVVVPEGKEALVALLSGRIHLLP